MFPTFPTNFIAYDNDQNLIKMGDILDKVIKVKPSNKMITIMLFVIGGLYAFLVNYIAVMNTEKIKMFKQCVLSLVTESSNSIINYNPTYFVMQLMLICLTGFLMMVIAMSMVAIHCAQLKIESLEQKIKDMQFQK
ncbi:MAG: hypothetical protein NT135_02180 [Candidatus Berkelbacteria bacterium]|nr:hypothetical protein [Candidatus Berkelbacteria bacterium]